MFSIVHEPVGGGGPALVDRGLGGPAAPAGGRRGRALRGSWSCSSSSQRAFESLPRGAGPRPSCDASTPASGSAPGCRGSWPRASRTSASAWSITWQVVLDARQRLRRRASLRLWRAARSAVGGLLVVVLGGRRSASDTPPLPAATSSRGSGRGSHRAPAAWAAPRAAPRPTTTVAAAARPRGSNRSAHDRPLAPRCAARSPATGRAAGSPRAAGRRVGEQHDAAGAPRSRQAAQEARCGSTSDAPLAGSSPST